ncbi:MAG: HlyD family efflux transporter periplasmic adaptor subunit [Planctomycetota bacterium]|nr:MAG: HlyD family efflux transporter periplasmic adaptor subunit [Planctomycetota bacterium]
MLHHAAQSTMVPSTQRPIPLIARPDLVFKRIEYLGVGYWVVKEPVGLKYYRLQPEQYHCLMLLDGKRNLEQLRDELLRRLPTIRLQLSDIQQLVTDLHEKGLVYSVRPGQGEALLKKREKERAKRLWETLRSLLYLRLPGWDPERTLTAIYPFFRWMFAPWAVGLTILTVLGAWVLLAVNFHQFRSQLPEFQSFFGWPNLLYLWLTLAVCKIIHEFGHGLACKHFGGECHEMGVLLLVFSPCLYCDVTDSWMMKNKWHRIAIGGAGMYIEVLLSAIAVFVWWNTNQGLIHNLALNVFFVTTITTVIFNANPLMRFDGYYMLADFLEIPNLRPKADRLLRETFAWYCLGIESKPDPFMPETGRFWFGLFAVSAWLYRWVIVASISVFLYTVLKPWGLQSIGITLLVVSLLTIVGNMVYNLYQIISAPRIEPMSRPKIAATLAVATLLVVGILAIPIPWHIEAMFIIEPHDVHHVYTATAGFVKEVHVEPGRFVRAGQLLVELQNPEMQDELERMKAERRVQQVEVELFKAVGDQSSLAVAQERLRTLEEQIAEYERQLAELEVRAPIAGRVIAPPRAQEPPVEQLRSSLSAWYGTPLDPRNRSALLEPRTHICSIAPDDRFQAILLVDQADRNDLKIGQRVELRFDHLPDRTYEGVVEDISERHLEFVPELLSNKLGGEVPTVTDAQGRERLLSIAYQTTVLVSQDTPLLRTGLRGRARFLVDTRTIGQWIWRFIRQTFLFRL